MIRADIIQDLTSHASAPSKTESKPNAAKIQKAIVGF
jgi:hypothetical protein